MFSFYLFITGVEIVWAVKDAWFTAAFIDPGAAEFFKPELTKDKQATEAVSKRCKYTIDNLKVCIYTLSIVTVSYIIINFKKFIQYLEKSSLLFSTQNLLI